MLRGRKQAGSGEPPGAPEWMVTFSDCMTLLLTFFVLLLSFSSFDEEIFERLEVIFAGGLPAVNPSKERDEDAFLSTKQIRPTDEISEGSEKPTLETGRQDHLTQETEPVDFRSRKVFLIPSENVFWGRGSVISFQGREVLAAMASFLKQVPSRVVISENGPEDKVGEYLGLYRAWAVMEYLVDKQHLNKHQFSISAASTVPKESFESGELGVAPERILEIVLLERSIYN